MGVIWTFKGVSTLLAAVILSTVLFNQLAGHSNIWGPIAPYINSHLKRVSHFPPNLINLVNPALYITNYIGSRTI